jgi:hypothetical protein
VEVLEDRLAPVTHTWSGAASSLWSDAGNWIEYVSPAGDPSPDLVFPSSGVTNFTSTDDLPGSTPIGSIRFDGSGFIVNAADPAIDTTALTYGTAGITADNPAGTNVLDIDLAFPSSAPVNFTVTNAGATLNLSGKLSGGVKGTPGVPAKYGQGTLIFSGRAYSDLETEHYGYFGGTVVQEGLLNIQKDSALGCH